MGIKKKKQWMISDTIRYDTIRYGIKSVHGTNEAGKKDKNAHTHRHIHTCEIVYNNEIATE